MVTLLPQEFCWWKKNGLWISILVACQQKAGCTMLVHNSWHESHEALWRLECLPDIHWCWKRHAEQCSQSACPIIAEHGKSWFAWPCLSWYSIMWINHINFVNHGICQKMTIAVMQQLRSCQSSWKKNPGFNRNRTHDLCVSGAML